MIEYDIKNCNNITKASIQIKKNFLNIRYAMNGTGKSTIAKAIRLNSAGEELDDLIPFGNSRKPNCTSSE